MWPAKRFASRFAPTEWISLAISVLALLVSTFTAYYGIVLTREHIQVFFDQLPKLQRDRANAVIVRPFETDMVIINSGNRPATILSVRFLYIQREIEFQTECDTLETHTVGGDIASIDTNFAGATIKEGELLRSKVRIKGPTFSGANINVSGEGDDKSFLINFRGAPSATQYMPLEMCLQVQLVTPSVPYYLAQPQVANYYISPFSEEARSPSQAFEVFKRRGTIFGD